MDYIFGEPTDEDWADIEELCSEVGWIQHEHNHQDILHHDTCPVCLMEWAIYGGNRQ